MNGSAENTHTNLWQVFLCYRRVDGNETALWLYKILQHRELPGSLTDSNLPPKLQVYYDQAAPAVSDWHQVHKPALEQSRALIVICTPGLYVRLKGDDWVHEELDWWLTKREAAPILIDPTGEGNRWIPDPIKKRWPNAQRIDIDFEEWKRLSPTDRSLKEDLVVERILGGITASEAKTRREDAEREHFLNAKLRRSLLLTACSLVAALNGIGASIWFGMQAEERQEALNRQFGLTLMEQAEDAWSENNETAARALAARALMYDRSPEVTHRYHMLYEWMEGHFDNAQKHVEQILDHDYQHLLDVAQLPQLAERLAKSRSAQRSLDNYLALGSKINKAQYDSVLRFKGLTHRVEAATRAQLFQQSNYQTLIDQLRLEQAKVAHIAYQASKDDNKDFEWSEQYIAAARQLATAYQNIPPAEFSHDPTLKWHQIQQYLKNNEALVDYMLYRGRYAVWILKNKGNPIRYELGEAGDIEENAKIFREIIIRNESIWSCGNLQDPPVITRGLVVGKESLPFTKDSGKVKFVRPENETEKVRKRGINPAHCRITPNVTKFYKQIWAPIENELGESIDTVYLVPDGVLATIPFSALPGRLSESYLFEDTLIVHLASAHDLLQDTTSPPTGKGVLLMGGADYGEHARQVNPKAFQIKLDEIPGTLKEIETIEKGLRNLPDIRPLVTYTDSAANESAFRQNAMGKRIIHLAAHGWMDFPLRNPWKNPEIASLPDNTEAYIATLNPLLRAGIALSPTNRAIEDGQRDGIVTALEVSTLDLRGVELVVLSACDTLGTREGGTTAIGLFRAFREAGAASVVATLFPVPDIETADLMARLYVHLHSTKSSAISLQKAMREMKSKGLSPYFWSGFVAYSPFRTANGADDLEGTR